MKRRSDRRKQAYQFIQRKLQESDAMPGRQGADNGFTGSISLAELDGLKQGLADPSRELVDGFRRFLGPLAGEAEINAYLIEPFLPGPRRPK